ncbi:hypothetical protein BDZ89DRAFT_1063906 [Hymenopellis radicata]|nr:hypothetical protein BDZ89DRAFT_1063906 [Hymenopellis radicata]
MLFATSAAEGAYNTRSFTCAVAGHAPMKPDIPLSAPSISPPSVPKPSPGTSCQNPPGPQDPNHGA